MKMFTSLSTCVTVAADIVVAPQVVSQLYCVSENNEQNYAAFITAPRFPRENEEERTKKGTHGRFAPSAR